MSLDKFLSKLRNCPSAIALDRFAYMVPCRNILTAVLQTGDWFTDDATPSYAIVNSMGLKRYDHVMKVNAKIRFQIPFSDYLWWKVFKCIRFSLNSKFDFRSKEMKIHCASAFIILTSFYFEDYLLFVLQNWTSFSVMKMNVWHRVLSLYVTLSSYVAITHLLFRSYVLVLKRTIIYCMMVLFR